MLNKKILVVSIIAVFILVAISFTSVVGLNTVKTANKKESPLYRIRTRRAIGERIGKIIDIIKTRFLGNRIFFIPLQFFRNYYKDNDNFYTKDTYYCKMCQPTAWMCR